MRILVILAGAVVTAVVLFVTRPQSHAGLRPPPLPRIDTVTVLQTAVQTTVTLAGRLQPARRASLPFEVAGQVIERRAEPGQAVARGDVLLLIDSGDYTDTVAEARAMLAQESRAIQRDNRLLLLAQKERKIMQRELKRLGLLEQQSLASKSRFEQAQRALLSQQEQEAALQHSVDTAPVRRARLQASLDRASRNLHRTRLLAPFSGVVNHVAVEVVDYVSRGQQVLELIQIEELDVYLEVNGQLARLLSPPQSVVVRHEQQAITGLIVAVSRAPDAATNTHAVRVRLPADGLHPGAIVRVELPGQFFAAAKVIPASALLRTASQDYVFEVNAGRLKRVPVSLRASLPGQYVIEGISAGAIIAERDVAAFQDGQQISVSAP